jgi:hypothetical protein
MKMNTLLKFSFLLIFYQLFAQYSTQTETTSTTRSVKLGNNLKYSLLIN